MEQWVDFRTEYLMNCALKLVSPFFGVFAESLTMERNFFSGTIPWEWENLWQLQSFSIQENSITGEMPNEICSLDQLEYLKADCVDEMYCWCCTECYEDPTDNREILASEGTTDPSATEVPTELV
jgi:hypothetical protein